MPPVFSSTQTQNYWRMKPKASVFPSSEIVLQTHIHSKNIFYECPLPSIFKAIANIYKSPKFNLHISLTGRHFAEFLRRPQYSISPAFHPPFFFHSRNPIAKRHCIVLPSPVFKEPPSGLMIMHSCPKSLGNKLVNN